jgi:hypothetical protein
VWNGDPLIFWADAFVTKFAVGTPLPPPSTPPPPPGGVLPAPALLCPLNDARFSRGTAIPFDWSDVSGAVTYTIQIDNSQSFSVPLTLEQNVSASQFTTGSLPATRMWWRVRANAASGVGGTWSAVRRIEIR